eukprot:7388448-Prymnesium_polylepis.1
MRHCCANRTPAFRLESTTTKRHSSHVPAPSKTPGPASQSCGQRHQPPPVSARSDAPPSHKREEDHAAVGQPTCRRRAALRKRLWR